MPIISLTQQDVERFSAASADRNPLHLDPNYSRRTPYGRPIVHGALAALATAAQLDAARLERSGGLRVIFRNPLFVDADYEIQSSDDGATRAVHLQRSDLRLLSVTPSSFINEADPGCIDDARIRPIATLDFDAEQPPDLARVLSEADLIKVGVEQGGYRPDWKALWRLADHFKFRHGDPWLACLAWVSFWTGMRTPGRDALLCGMHLQRDWTSSLKPLPEPDRISYRVHSPRFDRRTGSVGLVAHLAMPDASFRVEVESALRRSAPQATAINLAAQLTTAKRLEGRTVVVVGGSRGLGRALSLALAHLGATVHVVHRCSSDRVVDMQSELPSRDALVPVECDAGDPNALRSAMVQCPDYISGLILCAAPAIPSLPMSADATEEMLQYLNASVRLVWCPLTICAPRLMDDAFVLFASSSAVDHPPPWWPHYVAAKCAIEGLARFTGAQRPWKVTIARLPRLWTELSGTVTGSIGTVSTERVAARLLEHVLDDSQVSVDASGTRAAKVLMADELV